MDIMAFGSDDIENKIKNMKGDELDRLPFGAIQLDRSGKIMQYNSTEGQTTGRDPKAVIGKNFFYDVAPCTDSRDFKGRFDEGVRNGKLNTMFEYVFNYTSGGVKTKDIKVKVHMKNAPSGDLYWIFVKRVSIS